MPCGESRNGNPPRLPFPRRASITPMAQGSRRDFPKNGAAVRQFDLQPSVRRSGDVHHPRLIVTTQINGVLLQRGVCEGAADRASILHQSTPLPYRAFRCAKLGCNLRRRRVTAPALIIPAKQLGLYAHSSPLPLSEVRYASRKKRDLPRPARRPARRLPWHVAGPSAPAAQPFYGRPVGSIRRHHRREPFRRAVGNRLHRVGRQMCVAFRR